MEIDPALQLRLANANQTHLLAHWSHLNDDQRAVLLHDIAEVDFDRITRAFDGIKHELADKSAATAVETNGHGDAKEDNTPEMIDHVMEPIPDHLAGSIDEASKEQIEDYRQRGLKAVSQGAVGVLLLAGGQGTRLGVDYPKGMFDVGLPSKKSLYQIQAERIRRLEQLANERCNTKAATIPWFILTSEHTQQQTEDYFRGHDYFGLKPENIILFEQHTLPTLDFQGRILLDDKHKLTKAADGNGGLYRALMSRGILAEMERRHVKYVHVYCVDNILVRLADPIFVGFCLEKKADCAAKVVKKTYPGEAVGVICKVHGRFQVVEYSEISEQTAQRKKPDNSGELLFNAGNICNHFFTVDFLHDVCKNHENELRYHIAKKKIPSVSADGIRCDQPTEINGIKLEKFVFDVFPFSKTFAVWEVRREDEFSPLKNGSGTKDTAATCRRDLMLQHVRWLQVAGAELPATVTKQIVLSTTLHKDSTNSAVCEISPLVSYDGENLESFKGQTLDLPIIIDVHNKTGKTTVKSSSTNGINGVQH